MSDGTGMVPAPNSAPAGATTSNDATRKKPNQGKFKSGITVDQNKHGIRRETSNAPKPPKRTGRKKI